MHIKAIKIENYINKYTYRNQRMVKKQKYTITITIPAHLKVPARKYLDEIGMSLSGWVSDRLHKEMQERNLKKAY